MKWKKISIYFLALIILLICWGINLSTRATQGITGATVPPQPPAEIIDYFQLIALILFFLAALFIQRYPKPIFRYTILVFAIIFLGVYKKIMLTTGYILNLATGRWLPLAGNIFIYTLFLLILITSLLGKNTYCNYCCPFGAIQQLLYKISPFKLKFDKYLISQFCRFRYLFLWLVLVVALVLGGFRIAKLDPYITMFSMKGDWLGWMQLGLILGFSLLYYRIWCFHFCPAGAVIHIIGSIPRLKKVFSRTPLSIERTTWKDMFKRHTTYIFLIVFLLLLVITVSIIVVNLSRPIQRPVSIPPVEELLQQPPLPQQPSSMEEFTKYGIKPREAICYE